MDKRYTNMAVPPSSVLKEISFGNLKGKSDINPQWRIEIMTENFGLCGIGWKYEIVKQETVQVADGQILLYMTVAAQVKENNEWSAPVYGCGGDFIIEKNKNGLVPNDEAWKMCLTDALGNALKHFGVAAEVYKGNFSGTKYMKPRDTANTSVTAQQTIAMPKVQTQQALVRGMSDNVEVFIKGQWYKVAKMNKVQLEYVLKTKEYSAAHNTADAYYALIKDAEAQAIHTASTQETLPYES